VHIIYIVCPVNPAGGVYAQAACPKFASALIILPDEPLPAANAYDVPVAILNAGLVPAAGSPLACQVPFNANHNLPASISIATPIMAPVLYVDPKGVSTPYVALCPSNIYEYPIGEDDE
jgi:hypothetical protein